MASPPDDYYALLGLQPGADDAELRRAWRQLALQFHPDRAGPEMTARFQAISSAYAVLSDPLARAAYDRRLGVSRRASRPSPVPSQAAGAAPRRQAPGVMLQRISGNLRSLLASGAARRIDPGMVELILGSQEAEEGGMATIAMQVPVRCPDCTPEQKDCHRCGGKHATDELFSAWLAVPPGVADGTILEPSVLLRGMLHPVVFRVRLRQPPPAPRG